MEYKQCRCKMHEGDTLVPITEFCNNARSADGLSPTCRVCTKRERKQYKEQDVPRYLAKKKQIYYKHRDARIAYANKAYHERKFDPRLIVRTMYLAAKSRALRKGIEFNILQEDILVPEYCPVLGILLIRSEQQATDNSPTLDRIDNTKGYIKGNVAVISMRANRIKNCGTPDEHKKIYEYCISTSTFSSTD